MHRPPKQRAGGPTDFTGVLHITFTVRNSPLITTQYILTLILIVLCVSLAKVQSPGIQTQARGPCEGFLEMRLKSIIIFLIHFIVSHLN